jgi:hypothetical protein
MSSRFLRTAKKLVAGSLSGDHTKPLSRNFGYDRGTQSVARYYIDSFIASHASDIRGEVLEIGDNTYTARHGSKDVTHSDVLNVAPGAPGATLTADLTDAASLPTRVDQRRGITRAGWRIARHHVRHLAD